MRCGYGHHLHLIPLSHFDGSNYGGPDGSFGFIGSTPGGSQTLAVYGLETPIENLPTGTATYSGRSSIESWDSSLDTLDWEKAMTQLRGDARLEMNFGDGSLTGRIDNMTMRSPGENRFTALSTTTGFDIASGDIVNGQFAATITGTDTNTDAPFAESMRGFEGGVVGAAYNWNGNWLGGVFAAQRKIGDDDRSMVGSIWGRRQEQSTSTTRGLTVGDIDPLYHTRPEVLRYATLDNTFNIFRAYSANIIRNYNEATATVSSRYSIQSVAGDGDYGFYITYGDTESEVPNTIHFPRDAIRNGTYTLDELGYWLWSHSSSSYIGFNGNNYGGPDGSFAFIGSSFSGTPYSGRTMAVYGLETPIENLPTGTATIFWPIIHRILGQQSRHREHENGQDSVAW